jgi:hypothetical protein
MDGEKELLTAYNQDKLDRAMKREHLLNFLDKAREIEHMETTERIREQERYVRAIDTASNFDVVNDQPTITLERVLSRGGKLLY